MARPLVLASRSARTDQPPAQSASLSGHQAQAPLSPERRGGFSATRGPAELFQKANHVLRGNRGALTLDKAKPSPWLTLFLSVALNHVDVLSRGPRAYVTKIWPPTSSVQGSESAVPSSP